MAQSWEAIVADERSALLAKIPSEWRLPSSILSNPPRDVRPLFESSGVLNAQDIEITTTPDATNVLDKIRNGTWSAEDVTRAFCKRAAVAQQLLHCLMDIDFDGALKQAKALDEHFKRTGQVVGPLHGLPISIKDHIDVVNTKVTLGYVAWRDRVSTSDAVLVQTLRKAGAVLYVKTTMPQTGMMLETASNIWGRTLNPANILLSAGGSSGGEGALVGCLGSPLGVGTDIGGSIRAPCAFNGLYGLKPSSRRISYAGINTTLNGQIAILAVAGPMGRSVRDLSLFCETMCNDDHWIKDPSVVKRPWTNVAAPKKVTIGVMRWDEVVMPHPPIQRAINTAVEKLRSAGHEVIELKPYQHLRSWEITLPIYFATAGKEIRGTLASTGEPCFPAADKLISQAQPLSVPDLYKHHALRDAYRMEYLEYWNATASLTSDGKPIDAILCPSAASTSFPHDFLPWWGYFSTWNLLDYPSVIFPVTKVDASIDVADKTYVPANDRDKENWDMYDAELFNNVPVTLQLVGRGHAEEDLLAVAETVDIAVNKKA